MTVVWRDMLGYLQIEVDEYGIQFLDGYAHFSDDDGHEYQVPVEDMVAINMN